MSQTKPRYWLGDAPSVCDIDQTPIKDNFVDGATKMGPWANMCLGCHRTLGRGLGTGKGQHYHKEEDGRWLKIDG